MMHGSPAPLPHRWRECMPPLSAMLRLASTSLGDEKRNIFPEAGGSFNCYRCPATLLSPTALTAGASCRLTTTLRRAVLRVDVRASHEAWSSRGPRDATPSVLMSAPCTKRGSCRGPHDARVVPDARRRLASGWMPPTVVPPGWSAHGEQTEIATQREGGGGGEAASVSSSDSCQPLCRVPRWPGSPRARPEIHIGSRAFECVRQPWRHLVDRRRTVKTTSRATLSLSLERASRGHRRRAVCLNIICPHRGLFLDASGCISRCAGTP